MIIPKGPYRATIMNAPKAYILVGIVTEYGGGDTNLAPKLV
jgi:hypothetical protein